MKKMIISILMTLACLSALTAKAGVNVVIGEDQRGNVPENYPYSAIARVTNKTGKFCTGFMVSTTVLMTNAHCVLDENNNLYPVTDIEIFFQSQKKQFESRKITISKKYFSDKFKYDFAFIEIDEEAGVESGYFGTRAFESSMTKSENLQLSGYAVDYHNGWELFRQNNLCQAEKPDPNGLIMHNCDMEQGTSGAPLFIKRGEDKFYVVGINSRQSQKGACANFNDQECFNLAVPFQYIGDELLELLKSKG